MNASRRAVIQALAGPALIVGSVLIVLHLFAFSGLVSRQNPDVLPLWLPNYCLMGKSLAAGHIPAWNPSVMGGTPFAADPQSGWMYAPVMLLFSTLSCGRAIRWFIVLQPILAGLGIYAFARSEGLSRVAATVGGLALALPLAGSQVGQSLPFAGSIAWTALLLAAASKMMGAGAWPSRVVWTVVTALAWGQLAAAHLSNGFVLGTVALVVYLVSRSVSDVRRGVRSGRQVLALAGLLLFALPLVNLAYFLPRLAYLPRTSLGLGYDRLQVLSKAYSGQRPVGTLPGGAIRTTLPLRFVASPGLYLGATAFALSFAGWRARQRYLAIGTAVFGVLCYVASLEAVARTLAPHIRHWPLADFYLREPSRFAFGLPIAVAVLAALGVDAWRDARSWRERVVLVAPAVGVWGFLPLAFNADLRDLRLFAVGVAVAAIALVVSARRPLLLALLPAALAGELVASGLAGQAAPASNHREPHRDQVMLEPVYPLSRPDVEVGDYLQPGAIARALGADPPGVGGAPVRAAGRYISIDPEDWDVRGMHLRQQPAWWGFMATQRSMLYRLEEAQGYNATEERRYWVFMRAVDPRQIKYNAAFLMHPVPLALNLLDVGFIVSKTDRPPDIPGAEPIATEGQWTLFSITAPPRAELFPSWTPVQDGTEALDSLVHGTVDPGTTAVVELGGFDLQPQRGPSGGSAEFRWVSPQEARIDVDSPGLAALVIRNSYDPNWHAELDGRPVSLLHADYLLQGLFVSKGRHSVVLRYEDPTIGTGLVGSLCTLVLLLGGAFVLHRRRRTPHGAAVGESAPDADGDRSLVEAP